MWGAPVLICVYLLVKTILKQQASSLILGMVTPSVGTFVSTSLQLTNRYMVDPMLIINKSIVCSFVHVQGLSM